MHEEMNFRELLAGTEKSAKYAEEAALLEFTEELVRRMACEGVSRAELARRLGCSPAYITKVLRGPSNFTLASMARIAQALGCKLRMRMQPEGATAQWLEVLAERSLPQGVYTSSREMQLARRQYAPCRSKAPAKEVNHDRIPVAS